mmetsp:Transcript_2221/g.3459  ORF Transcript_2221/g.3459 Transcript_2221/m.3459 type:complete len:100 (+) Transcript_2221:183-482(+)
MNTSRVCLRNKMNLFRIYLQILGISMLRAASAILLLSHLKDLHVHWQYSTKGGVRCCFSKMKSTLSGVENYIGSIFFLKCILSFDQIEGVLLSSVFWTL